MRFLDSKKQPYGSALFYLNDIHKQIALNMRQITYESCKAFYNATNYKNGNTQVIRLNDEGTDVEMRLHGNLIAYSDHEGIYISNGGWATNTTKDRLNGFDGVHIQQRNFQWFLNGESWDGSWIKISD